MFLPRERLETAPTGIPLQVLAGVSDFPKMKDGKYPIEYFISIFAQNVELLGLKQAVLQLLTSLANKEHSSVEFKYIALFAKEALGDFSKFKLNELAIKEDILVSGLDGALDHRIFGQLVFLLNSKNDVEKQKRLDEVLDMWGLLPNGANLSGKYKEANGTTKVGDWMRSIFGSADKRADAKSNLKAFRVANTTQRSLMKENEELASKYSLNELIDQAKNNDIGQVGRASEHLMRQIRMQNTNFTEGLDIKPKSSIPPVKLPSAVNYAGQAIQYKAFGQDKKGQNSVTNPLSPNPKSSSKMSAKDIADLVGTGIKSGLSIASFFAQDDKDNKILQIAKNAAEKIKTQEKGSTNATSLPNDVSPTSPLKKENVYDWLKIFTGSSEGKTTSYEGGGETSDGGDNAQNGGDNAQSGGDMQVKKAGFFKTNNILLFLGGGSLLATVAYSVYAQRRKAETPTNKKPLSGLYLKKTSPRPTKKVLKHKKSAKKYCFINLQQ